MRLLFVNIMHELHDFDSTTAISQPPVPLGILNRCTPPEIETALIDEQTEKVDFEGDVFAFTLSTQYAGKVYGYADRIRATGKKVILGGIHVTACPDEAVQHADAIVTGEAETIWPEVCADLLSGNLKSRYLGEPTPADQMLAVDYRFFARRPYLTPASLYATRGCNHRCSFCVSSGFLGPFRTKPLAVLENEIEQLQALYPRAFLQFTDDNLLADRDYTAEVLAMLRKKERRFITMVTLDQFCDGALIQEMADSGCLGVAVGIESLDDENCVSINKRHNVGRPLVEAASRAASLGLQVCGLIMIGLPHDTPQGLVRAFERLQQLPFTLYDLRILRIFPGSRLYDQMRASGQVTPKWWLGPEPVPTNYCLPGHLRVHFKHPRFTPLQLQRCALDMTRKLNRITPQTASRIMRVGRRAGALGFATLLLHARARVLKQARELRRRLVTIGDATTWDGPENLTDQPPPSTSV